MKNLYLGCEVSKDELESRYSSVKSFYGKAFIVNSASGDTFLESYGTRVAEVVNGKFKVLGHYSSTTTRHIKEYAKQNGFTDKDIKAIFKNM